MRQATRKSLIFRLPSRSVCDAPPLFLLLLLISEKQVTNFTPIAQLVSLMSQMDKKTPTYFGWCFRNFDFLFSNT